MDRYCIKEPYACNLTENGERIAQYTAPPNNAEYQYACYDLAKTLVRSRLITSCIELGSGSGLKLNKYIKPYCRRTVGVDLPHSIERCRQMYPGIEWVVDDFDNSEPAIGEKFDLVLCFDVIEHIVNPESLLIKIRQYAHPGSVILLSTPERDSLRGQSHQGPPPNVLHIREWDRVEFREFISRHGFTIISQKIVDAHRLSFRQRLSQFFGRANYRTCQIVECRL